MCSWSYTVNTKNYMRGRVVAGSQYISDSWNNKTLCCKTVMLGGCFVARKWNIWNGREFFWICSEMEVLVCGTTQVFWLQSLALEKVCRIQSFKAGLGCVVEYVLMQEHGCVFRQKPDVPQWQDVRSLNLQGCNNTNNWKRSCSHFKTPSVTCTYLMCVLSYQT